MKKRVFTVLLAAILLYGCNEGATNEDTTDTAFTVETENTESIAAETELHDDLPDDLDFDGTEIGICSSQHVAFNGNLDVAEYDENSSALDQAIYDRNRNVEERLNVKIHEYLSAIGADDAGKVFTNSVTAGDDAYTILHQADRTVFHSV